MAIFTHYFTDDHGIVGLALYLTCLGLLLMNGLRLSKIRLFAVGILTIIYIAGFSASAFLSSAAGFFYIVMIALSLSSSKQTSATLLSADEVLKDGRLRQAQLKMLNMLQIIDAICVKHQLDYWLDAGTLLGAVRHQGFIPWDDDMDIGMPRASYEAFLRIAPTEMSEYIWLQTAETDKGYYNLGAPLKIRDKNSYYLEKHENGDEPYQQGIFIDVFVYDYMPENPKIRKRYKVMAKKLLRLLSTKYSRVPMGHYAGLYRAIGFFLPKALLEKWLQLIIHRSNQSNHQYLGRGYQCKISNLIHHDDVYPLRRVPFESGQFNVFNRVDAFLTAQYGDYLSLPPEEQRTMRHCKALIPDITIKSTQHHIVNEIVERPAATG